LHITEFTVAGLAGRREKLSQVLYPDLNIFFGPNGSGKTSLLRILHSGLQRKASILTRTPFLHAEFKLFWNANRTYSCSLDNTPEDTSGPEQSSVDSTVALVAPSLASAMREESKKTQREWVVTPNQTEGYRGWGHSYLPTTRLILGGPLSRNLFPPSSDETELELDTYFQSALQQLWSSYMSDVLEAVRKAQAEGLANILRWIMTPKHKPAKPDDSMPDVDLAFTRVSAFLARQGAQAGLGSKTTFRRRYARNKLLKGVVGYIDEVEQRIERAMMPRNKLQELIQRLFTGNKVVSFTDTTINVVTDDNSSIGVANLSSGEKHVLRILVEALQAGSGALLIDEPEISMHVDWQKELVPALQAVNPNAQLIIATHSPEIMADVDDSRIFRI